MEIQVKFVVSLDHDLRIAGRPQQDEGVGLCLKAVTYLCSGLSEEKMSVKIDITYPTFQALSDLLKKH